MRTFLIITAVLLAALSCGGGGGEGSGLDGLRVDSAVVRDTVRLANDTDAPVCEVSVSMPFVIGKNDAEINRAIIQSGVLLPSVFLQAMKGLDTRHAVDSFVRRYKSDYKEFYTEMYRNDREHPRLYDCRYTLNARLESHRRNVITCVASVSLYAGGQRSTRQTIARNIRTDSLAAMTTADLYIHGYEKALQDILVRKLCETFDADGLDALKEKMICADGDIYIPQNFILGSDKVTFIYCEDEIAPHDIGEIRIDVSDKEMGRLVKAAGQEAGEEPDD